MNCLNKLLIGIKAETKAKAGAKEIKPGEENVKVFRANMGFKLGNSKTEASQYILEEIELLDQINLLSFSLICFWAMF